MQTSGPISIGQARNECGQGNPIDAGNYYLSRLAGVGQGQRYAWSYWYGKSNVAPLNNYYLGNIAVNADRYVYTYFDLVNWRFQWSQNSGDNNSGVMWVNTGTQQQINQGNAGNWIGLSGTPIPQIQAYKTLSASVAFQAGNNRTIVQVTQQPSAANGWVLGVTWNDDPWGGAAASQYAIYLNGSA
jgi:hypothetical protein